MDDNTKVIIILTVVILVPSIGYYYILTTPVYHPTATSTGGFSYDPVSGTCSSGPASPSGYYDGSGIKIMDGKLVGPCNGDLDGDTPGWGTKDCCLQVCLNYNMANEHCDLKEEFAQLFEA